MHNAQTHGTHGHGQQAAAALTSTGTRQGGAAACILVTQQGAELNRSNAGAHVSLFL